MDFKQAKCSLFSKEKVTPLSSCPTVGEGGEGGKRGRKEGGRGKNRERGGKGGKRGGEGKTRGRGEEKNQFLKGKLKRKKQIKNKNKQTNKEMFSFQGSISLAWIALQTQAQAQV